MAKRKTRKKKSEPQRGPAGNLDFVEHSSERHMNLLGLRKLEKDEETQYAHKGFTLVDITAWGAAARPEFVTAQLRQRVAEFESGKPPKTQSENPMLPNYAPELWVPHDEDAGQVPVRGIV